MFFLFNEKKLDVSFNENKLVNDRHHTLCQALNEFSCKNGNCILLSKYCDGANDCGDNSDESLDCTSKYTFDKNV